MRISDWSSDVCSSDLVAVRQMGKAQHAEHQGDSDGAERVDRAEHDARHQVEIDEVHEWHRRQPLPSAAKEHLGDLAVGEEPLPGALGAVASGGEDIGAVAEGDRKSTRLNSSH